MRASGETRTCAVICRVRRWPRPTRSSPVSRTYESYVSPTASTSRAWWHPADRPPEESRCPPCDRRGARRCLARSSGDASNGRRPGTGCSALGWVTWRDAASTGRGALAVQASAAEMGGVVQSDGGRSGASQRACVGRSAPLSSGRTSELRPPSCASGRTPSRGSWSRPAPHHFEGVEARSDRSDVGGWQPATIRA